MACAGYLVRNNTTVVYAEIVNGMLVCTAAAQHRATAALLASVAAAEEEKEEDEEDKNANVGASLPLLAPKRMERAPSFLVKKVKRRASKASPQPEDEPTDDEEDDDDLDQDEDEYTAQPVYEAPRVVQLSGHVVEIVDCAAEHDSNVVSLMPFSFRIQTKRMTLHADASYSFTSGDTLLLAAVDQATKDEWMKRLPRWSRYGWRDTTYLAATDEDVDLLELALQRWRDSEVSSVMKPATLAFGYAAAAATRSSSSRRRFYRHTGSITSAYAPVEAADDSAWFQMRVVKTHI